MTTAQISSEDSPANSNPRFLPTGIRGLDTVLCSGLRAPSIVVIEGMPGTGKTILASQLAQRATSELDESALYFTFEMPEDLYFENLASFNWDLRNKSGDSQRLHFMQMAPAQFVEDVTINSALFREKFARSKCAK